MVSGSQIESGTVNRPIRSVAGAGVCAEVCAGPAVAAMALPVTVIWLNSVSTDATGVGQSVTVIRAQVPLEASGPTVTRASPGSIRRVIVRTPRHIFGPWDVSRDVSPKATGRARQGLTGACWPPWQPAMQTPISLAGNRVHRMHHG